VIGSAGQGRSVKKNIPVVAFLQALVAGYEMLFPAPPFSKKIGSIPHQMDCAYTEDQNCK
jgi:hypothetical protein